MTPLNPECKKAVDTLVLTGMNPFRAELLVADLHRLYPAADAVQLTLMGLNEKRAPQTLQGAITKAEAESAKLGLKVGFGWTLGQGLASIMVSILFLGGVALVLVVAFYIFAILYR